MIFKALLALFLALPATAQQGVEAIDCFWGLNDTDSPASINRCQAQDLLNVESNLTGTSAKKRLGVTREASLTITTGPVTGATEFKCDNGDVVRVVCHDRYCSKSTNGAAFAVFLSTAGGVGAVPVRWSFASVDGDLYGANDRRDAILKYDCTNLTHPSGIPAGSVLALTEDRLVVGDTSANPNRIAYSKSGDFSTFTTGSASVDPFTDDLGAPGDRTTGLIYNNGILWIFRSRSILSCETGDQYTTRCSIFSPNIGTEDPNSIVIARGSIYFRGQDRAYWVIGPNGSLDQTSKQIKQFTNNQLSGSVRSNVQTTQADWEAGAQSPSSSWLTTAISGSVLPSSVTFVDTSSTQFAAGTILDLSVNDTVGSLLLSSNTARDDFSDGDYTAGSTTWTVTSGGSFEITTTGSFPANRLHPTTSSTGGQFQNRIHTTNIVYSTGSWSWTWRYVPSGTNVCANTLGDSCFDFRFMKKTNGDFYTVRVTDVDSTITKNVQIVKNVSGTDTVLASAQYSFSTSTDYSFNVVRKNGDGVLFVTIGGVFVSSATDTAITSATSLEITGQKTTVIDMLFDDISFYQYRTKGTITSQTFDTTFSTPIWGTFNSTFTFGTGEGAISFWTQASSDGSSWDTRVASSDTLKIASAAKRYIRYQSELTTYVSTKTPSITDISLIGATTGQFTTQCIQPGTGITAWGILSCDSTTGGNGSFTISIATNTDCTSISTSTYYSQTNNATITAPTAAAIKLRFVSLLGSATDQAQVNSCTTYWNEGSVAQPVWGVFDSIGNAIYWTATTTAATQGDRVIKYDLNLNEWYPFDLRATALGYFANNIYFGSSTGGYWNKYAPTGVNTDNGANINAYWKSKDFGGSDPFVEKSWQGISLLARNNVTGNFTTTWTDSFNKSDSYTVSLATSSTINYIRSSYAMKVRSPSNFMNVKIGNNSSTPFEVLGLRLNYFSQPWKVANP